MSIGAREETEMSDVFEDRQGRVIASAFSRTVGPRIDGALISNALLERSELVSTLLDPRRDVDAECHYPETRDVTPEQYKQLYDRDPIACRVVQCIAKESWQGQPTVFEAEDPEVTTPFEEAWDALQPMNSGSSWYKAEEAGSVWEYLMRADILSGIGHFGVLLMGFDDGKNLQEPVEGVTVVTNAASGSRYQYHDCYLTKAEEDNLRNLRNLNEMERAVLNQLARQREITVNFMQAQQDRKNGNGREYMQTDRPQDAQVFGEATSDEQVQGTDKQYSQEFGLRGEADYSPGLSGTDQQYFGVQFGPTELPSKETSQKKLRLLFLRPFDESLVQIVRYEWNINNPRFGMPVMYRITLNDPREQHSGIGLPMATVFVHWSRVIHLADNLNSSEIFGAPRMRPVLNRLLDLQKIYGASAEGYWQAAFTGISLETHPQLGGDVTIDAADVRNQIENYVNSLQRYLALTGMSAKTLAPTVSDPTSQITVHLEAICVQLGIPVRIFRGSERGELASSQDDASWNDRLKARQQGYVTPRIIVPFVDRLISVGVLPEPSYVEPEEQEVDEFGYPIEATDDQFPWEEQPQYDENGQPIVPEEEWSDEEAEEEAIYDPGQDGEGTDGGGEVGDLEQGDDEDMAGSETDYGDKPQTDDEDEEDRTPAGLTKNTFCATGPGGGKDPSCRGGGKATPSNPDAGKYPHLAHLMNGQKVGSSGHDKKAAYAKAQGLRAKGIYAGVLKDPRGERGKQYMVMLPVHNRRYGPILNDDGEQVGMRTKTGYSVVWPDLDSNTDKDKAMIASTKTQAIAAYVAGNVESVMPLLEFYTKIMGMSDEEAGPLVQAAEAQQMAMEQQAAEQQMGQLGVGPNGLPIPGMEQPDMEQGAEADFNDDQMPELGNDQ